MRMREGRPIRSTMPCSTSASASNTIGPSKAWDSACTIAAMLPQSPGVDPKTCIPELEKCVKQYGCVGINLNPAPSGGHWTSPPLSDRQWYPIYEKMVELD